MNASIGKMLKATRMEKKTCIIVVNWNRAQITNVVENAHERNRV
jgi:hypothetical protein